MITSYIKKIPVSAGMIFLSVAAFSALQSGSGIVPALYRGAIAGVIGYTFAYLFVYILFKKDMPEPEIPEEYKHIGDKLKGKK